MDYTTLPMAKDDAIITAAAAGRTKVPMAELYSSFTGWRETTGQRITPLVGP
jgi:hypothetical protein